MSNTKANLYMIDGAKTVLVYVQISSDEGLHVEISKAKARMLAKTFPKMEVIVLDRDAASITLN